MSIHFLGLLLTTLGEVLLGVAVVMVHLRVIKEHGIDKKVMSAMLRERNIAFLAILLILAGFLLEAMHFGYIPNLL